MAEQGETSQPVEELGRLSELVTQVVAHSLSRFEYAGVVNVTLHYYNYVGNVVTDNTQTPQNNRSNIHLTGSNQGSINVVQGSENVRISNNINTLREHTQTQTIADAFVELQNAVNGSTDLDDKAKSELLSAISLLSEQAGKNTSDRTSWHIDAAFDYLTKTISTVGTLSTLWSKWGGTISSFFGLSV